MDKKSLKDLIWHITRLAIGGFLLSILLWKWFGNNLNLRSSSFIDINFFFTISGVYTIIGLVVTIYQIVDLKDRKILRENTKAEVRIEMFRDEVLFELGKFQNMLKDLNDRVQSNPIVSEQVINSYLSDIYVIDDKVKYMQSRQQTLNCDVIGNCGMLLTLQTSIISDLIAIINDSSYITFRKNSLIDKIRKLNHQFTICQSNI